ncbi:hypothetical protein TNIN_308531 [Trichonephila inaurata madagascariensis]|uniref:Uncharacterized protein n=1 Tax=Trichonephila inaurata madagascariensis TaxID=2747483 RepID=A0A8X6I515_9ARAC|nr:hypothetical protein TNIN_308531 [Trichonephila inaurata madagascariensis]
MPPLPKPRKGKTINNNYTTVVESIVRPNVSYAQATNPQPTSSNKNTHQMATRNEVPVIPQQPQANRKINIPPAAPINNIPENPPQYAIVQTLQETMQTLAVLTQQIAALNFNTPPPPPKKNLKNRDDRLYALLEAILNKAYDD